MEKKREKIKLIIQIIISTNEFNSLFLKKWSNLINIEDQILFECFFNLIY